ncbi:MAG: TetR/AcrR family transcriptional regulator [Parvularculales bacterium]
MSGQPKLEIIDGRHKRSERSRAAIITATLNLVDNGNLSPTARQIAEEAGVGLRSFFRHFEDMDALFDTIDRHLRKYYEQLFNRPFSNGCLEERIADIVTGRSEAYERLKKMMMSTQAQLWRSGTLQKNYARNQERLRKHLEKWLPELQSLPKGKREAAHAAASFDMWHRLRHHQKLNISEAREAIIAMLHGLLG